MTCGSETWPAMKEPVKPVGAEMRMLRWSSGKTGRNRIRNDIIRGVAGALEVSRNGGYNGSDACRRECAKCRSRQGEERGGKITVTKRFGIIYYRFQVSLIKEL